MRAFCLIVFAVVGALPSSGQQLKMSDLEKSVVQIGVVKQDKTFAGLGTGFFVSGDGLIATAFHVYSAAVQGVAENRGGTVSAERAIRQTGNQTSTTAQAVNLVAVDPLHDLALLKLGSYAKADQEAWDKVGGIKALLIYTAPDIENGSNVRTVGYFGSDAFPVIEKTVLVGGTFVITPVGPVDEFLVSALAVPGQSGSPVVLDDGTVVGVVLSIVTFTAPFNPQSLPSGLNRVAKAEFLQRLLSSAPK
jgi:S1-C subfamily serine protease